MKKKSLSKLKKERPTEYNVAKYTCVCKSCGKEFGIGKWQVGRAKYCSYDCSVKGRTSDKAYTKPRICESCGKEYLPTHWYQKNCNRQCFLDSVHRMKMKICPVCNKEFKQTRREQVFCSRKCGLPYGSAKQEHFNKDTTDRYWAILVKELAGNKCEFCGKEQSLNSHHIFSRSNMATRWETDNGICLCVGHHVFGNMSAHKSPIEFVEWLKEKRGEEWYERLRTRAKSICKLSEPDKIGIRNTLRDRLVEFGITNPR
jgi:hypothetical protein